MADVGRAAAAIVQMIEDLKSAQALAEMASNDLLDISWAGSDRRRLVQCQFHINTVLALLEAEPIQFPD